MPEPSNNQFSLSPIPDSSIESNNDGMVLYYNVFRL